VLQAVTIRAIQPDDIDANQVDDGYSVVLRTSCETDLQKPLERTQVVTKQKEITEVCVADAVDSTRAAGHDNRDLRWRRPARSASG
jgi:hypothetical protein